MEDQIRSALASKDYALAQTLADDWLSREPNLAAAHYFAAWSRDAQGLEADALIHYEKALKLGLSGEDLRGALEAQARAIWPQEMPLFKRYGLPANPQILD